MIEVPVELGPLNFSALKPSLPQMSQVKPTNSKLADTKYNENCTHDLVWNARMQWHIPANQATVIL